MRKLLSIIFLLPPFLLPSCSREAEKEIITDQFLRYHENIEAAALVDSGNFGRVKLDKKGIPVTAVTWVSSNRWEKYYFDNKGRIIKQEFLPAIKNDTACQSTKYRYDEKGRLSESACTFKKNGGKLKRYLYDSYGLTEIRWLTARGILESRTRIEYNFNDMTVSFISEAGKNKKTQVLLFEKKKNPSGFTLYDNTMVLNLLPKEFQKRSIKKVKNYTNGQLKEVKKPKASPFQ